MKQNTLSKSVNKEIHIADNRKLIVIKSDKGYYNGEDNFFYPDLGNATWCSSPAQARGIINKFNLENADFEELEELEFWEAKAQLSAELIIICSILKMKLSNDAKHAFRFFGGKKKGLKKLVLDMENALKDIDKEFDILAGTSEKIENDMYDVQGWYYNMIHFIAKNGFHHSQNFSELAEGLYKDEKSVKGIINKVLKK